MQSPKVLLSGTVGPEPMTSSGSPTTSDRMKAIRVDGYASRAKPPPLSLEMCLRMALISLIFAPHSRRRLVIFCLSSREIPSAGEGSRADPPPEMRQITRSFSPNFSSSSAISSAPETPLWSGMGWPTSLSLTLFNSERCPYFTLMTPRVIRSPRISSTAKAIEAPAFPPPVTETWP